MPDAPAWIANSFGAIAGACSMLSFVPQIAKILRERDASAISLRMYAVTIVGFVCWTIFGLLTNSLPVAIANGVCLVLVCTIFVLRLRFGGKDA